MGENKFINAFIHIG